ncbi:LuxR C-terminal-related transcriptional regulator [Terracoccus sp. 273MFTsu3.1]|uniref:helix-turn-helix transcriptional regulator n=1 Tax=Terracoccus sp. 273MFTsu3.1 TaxID=1172188 RepID=UPI000377CC39|nr:LuxR C-terminal-related transcriptional regulator [Terracoccus sp. 273MFTsu3.1]
MTSPTSGSGASRDDAQLRAPSLAAAAVELSSVVNALAVTSLTGGRTPGFRRLGVGAEQIERNLATAVEPLTHRSVWSIQPLMNFDPVDGSRTTNARSIERGLTLITITTERTLRLNPLLSSEKPDVRVGPAQFQCIIADEATAIVAGPLSEDGFPTAWLATRSDVVDRVLSLWHETLARSRRAVPEGTSPPFTPRQCLVARRLVVGTKDAAIARELGVSLRTVAADISHLVTQLGAPNRAAATLALRGGTQTSELSPCAPYLRSVREP